MFFNCFSLYSLYSSIVFSSLLLFVYLWLPLCFCHAMSVSVSELGSMTCCCLCNVCISELGSMTCCRLCNGVCKSLWRNFLTVTHTIKITPNKEQQTHTHTHAHTHTHRGKGKTVNVETKYILLSQGIILAYFQSNVAIRIMNKLAQTDYIAPASSKSLSVHVTNVQEITLFVSPPSPPPSAFKCIERFMYFSSCLPPTQPHRSKGKTKLNNVTHHSS